MSSPASPPAALVLCCKAPHRSKRRLAAQLGHAAVEAAERLLACALEDLRDWAGPAVIAPASKDDAAWLASRFAVGCDTVVQQGGSLGERINHVDRVLRCRGWERLIYIGADCPALDRGYLDAADAALEDHDAVLGPATDGGVVLMGARRPWPAFGDLPWSAAALLEALAARLAHDGWTVARLDTLADVDTVDELRAAGTELEGDPRAARRALVDWLESRDSFRDAS